jgi:hypothetical protein
MRLLDGSSDKLALNAKLFIGLKWSIQSMPLNSQRNQGLVPGHWWARV